MACCIPASALLHANFYRGCVLFHPFCRSAGGFLVCRTLRDQASHAHSTNARLIQVGQEAEAAAAHSAAQAGKERERR